MPREINWVFGLGMLRILDNDRQGYGLSSIKYFIQIIYRHQIIWLKSYIGIVEFKVYLKILFNKILFLVHAERCDNKLRITFDKSGVNLLLVNKEQIKMWLTDIDALIHFWILSSPKLC